MKIVIFGANELGCLIATELFEDHDIIVIDREENRTEDFNKLDISFVYGNGSNIGVLEEARISEADVFIACTDLEEGNVVACLTAKSMSDAKTVCFVSKQETVESLMLVKGSKYQSGLLIDHIIWPEELLTQEIFRIITVPNAIDVENFAQGQARLLEYRIKDESSILNKKIKDCIFPDETLIVGITRDSKLFIPDGETVLELNDKVIFMGSAYSLDILASKFFQQTTSVQSVCIIGGGSVGLMLAQNLEKLNLKTKIIERDYKRCEFLTENLKKTLVLNGDGTNLELLQNESIEDSDVVISVTNNDEKNLLCSLLAKQLGVKKVITRVCNGTNVGLFEKVGIDVAVSPNSAAIDDIQNNLIQTDIDILATVERGQGEIIEMPISHDFEYKRIMDLQLPEKAIIAIIKRWNKVIIPKGTTHIMAGDTIILFTQEENSTKIKSYFKGE